MNFISHNNWNLNVHSKLDSTMLEMVRIINDSAKLENLAVLSYEQTHGRGRYGNKWTSPKGNFYFSFLADSSKLLLSHSYLVFLLAVTVCELIIKLSKINILPRIKWPNDILINNKKVSGILIENYKKSDGLSYIIVGVGINIESHPVNSDYEATNLFFETNEKYDVVKIARLLLDEFDGLIYKLNAKGFSFIREKWIYHSIPLGKRIRVKINKKEKVEGIYRGIGEDGALLFENMSGKIERFLSTEVIEEVLS